MHDFPAWLSTLADGLNLNNWSTIPRRLGRHRCLLCMGHEPGPRGTICAGCLADLPWVEEAPRAPPPMVSLTVAFQYEDPVKYLIRRAKYRGETGTCRVLGRLLGATVRQSCVELPDVLVPVPMPALRVLSRGHNHAVWIARELARETGVPLATGILRRQGWQRPQQRSGRQARRRNLARAFAVDIPLQGLRVGVVDDVVTTGATLEATATALLTAGADAVEAFAVAIREWR